MKPGHVYRVRRVLPDHNEPTPCVPSKASGECLGCARLQRSRALTAGSCDQIIIDASTVKRPGETCRMLA